MIDYVYILLLTVEALNKYLVSYSEQ